MTKKLKYKTYGAETSIFSLIHRYHAQNERKKHNPTDNVQVMLIQEPQITSRKLQDLFLLIQLSIVKRQFDPLHLLIHVRRKTLAEELFVQDHVRFLTPVQKGVILTHVKHVVQFHVANVRQSEVTGLQLTSRPGLVTVADPEVHGLRVQVDHGTGLTVDSLCYAIICESFDHFDIHRF